MSRLPPRHRTRSHVQLRSELLEAAQDNFADAHSVWRPVDGDERSTHDLGAGLLDAFAVALHVLWTYQEAWAEEGFLATARLPSSARGLLRHIRYEPSAGTAAVGLQHFECKADSAAVLPAGTAVSAPAKAGREAVFYETLRPLDLRPELNEVQVFLPSDQPSAKPVRPPFSGTPSMDGGEPAALAPPGSLLGPDSVLDALRDRLDSQRAGERDARKARRAAQQAKRLASLVNSLGRAEAGPAGKAGVVGKAGTAAGASKEALEAACKALCEAQRIAAAAPKSPPGPLSESQELLDRQLRKLGKRQDAAAQALESALAQTACESSAEYAERLDNIMTFLDGLVTGLIQEARDQIVLLRGSDALNRLDSAYGDKGRRRYQLGRASQGVDTLYLVELESSRVTDTLYDSVKPGDRFVIARVRESVALDGKVTRSRSYEQAIRVTRVRPVHVAEVDEVLTRITFEPSLMRAYDLRELVLVGNVVQISEGRSVRETLEREHGRRTMTLTQAPLTWIRDAAARGGRRPLIELEVDGRAWTRVEDLLDVGPEDPVYCVEMAPSGEAWVRTGDGRKGAALAGGARVVARYRIGLGARGNVRGSSVDQLVTAHPSVVRTFNPLDLDQGSNPEPGDRARTLGPLQIRALDRAVSESDVRALALVYDGVDRARVFRDSVHRRRTVTVVAVGDGGKQLSDPELDQLRVHLQARVPPGIHVNTEHHVGVPICLQLLLRRDSRADPIELEARVRARLGLDSLADEPARWMDPDTVALGAPLHLSQIYEALEGLDGLQSVVVTALHYQTEDPKLAAKLTFARHELPVWKTIPDKPDPIVIRHEEARDR